MHPGLLRSARRTRRCRRYRRATTRTGCFIAIAKREHRHEQDMYEGVDMVQGHRELLTARASVFIARRNDDAPKSRFADKKKHGRNISTDSNDNKPIGLGMRNSPQDCASSYRFCRSTEPRIRPEFREALSPAFGPQRSSVRCEARPVMKRCCLCASLSTTDR